MLKNLLNTQTQNDIKITSWFWQRSLCGASGYGLDRLMWDPIYCDDEELGNWDLVSCTTLHKKDG